MLDSTFSYYPVEQIISCRLCVTIKQQCCLFESTNKVCVKRDQLIQESSLLPLISILPSASVAKINFFRFLPEVVTYWVELRCALFCKEMTNMHVCHWRNKLVNVRFRMREVQVSKILDRTSASRAVWPSVFRYELIRHVLLVEAIVYRLFMISSQYFS